jgi:hypothetical protein
MLGGTVSRRFMVLCGMSECLPPVRLVKILPGIDDE